MKTRIKRCLAMLMALMMCLSLVQVTASAEAGNTVASGTCGENLTWVLDVSGTLTISGTGDMEDYSDGYSPIWLNDTYIVKNVYI